VQAAKEAERRREQSNLARMQAVQRRFTHEAVRNEPKWAGNPEQLLSRRERAVAREEITALRNVRQRGSSAPDPFPGTSDPEELRGTVLYPSWYPRDEEDDDETPLPGTAAINDLKFHGLKPYLIYAILNPNSVAAHHAEGGAWQDMTSNAPNDDLLRVAPRSPKQLREHCIPIGFARHPEECENFAGIVGTTPTRGQSTANGHTHTTHTLGETCVVVWSTSRKEATMLCGFGNLNNRWNRPGGISKEDWSGARGVQPNRFRLSTLNAEAAHINRDERAFSDSNRVLG
jgi:hypothetical protein